MEMLEIEELSTYLLQEGISKKTTEMLSAEMISGLALTLLEEAELKEVVPILGDRAIIRSLLKRHREAKQLNCAAQCTETATSSTVHPPVLESSLDGTFREVSMDDLTQMMESVDHSILSEIEMSSLKEEQRSNIEMAEMYEPAVTGNHDSSILMSNDLSSIWPKPRKSQRPQEDPLPRPFNLPNEFPPSVDAALLKKKLFGRPRAKFVTIVSQAIHKYKDYPTRDELEHVVQQIFKKWPFLEQDGMRSYITSIQVRMSYLRKPEGHKRGNPDKKSGTPKPIKSGTSSKLLLPSQPEGPQLSVGEDQKSIECHYKLLKAELKKPTPRRMVVDDLMNRTFPKRRNEIMSSVPLQQIQEMYPTLNCPTELLKEFNRIFEKDVTSSADTKWSFFLSKAERVDEEHYTQAKELLGCECVSTFSEDFKHVIAIVLLLLLLPDVRTKQDITKVITVLNTGYNIADITQQLPTSQPCLVVRYDDWIVRDCSLIMEKKVLCSVPMSKAMVVLFATFFVFNTNYPTGANNFYTFLESFFLQKTTMSKKTRVITLTSYINNMD